MQQFLETICIIDGQARHLEWHQRRLDATMRHFYPQHRHGWPLKEALKVPEEFCGGMIKCRIIYDAHKFSLHFEHYLPRATDFLRIVEVPAAFTYMYKYADRTMLEEYFSKRGDADDVLLVRNGWITDTSVANIAFEKNNRWFTPSMPLLAGTSWKRLILEGILIPRPINMTELQTFDRFKVFNAMNAWEAATELSIGNISE